MPRYPLSRYRYHFDLLHIIIYYLYLFLILITFHLWCNNYLSPIFMSLCSFLWSLFLFIVILCSNDRRYFHPQHLRISWQNNSMRTKCRNSPPIVAYSSSYYYFYYFYYYYRKLALPINILCVARA